MAIQFNSIEELYKRVKPALTSKVRELKRNKIDYIKEEDIWNYLIQKKWISSRGLELSDIVNDILNTENRQIEEYVKETIEQRKTQANTKNIEII